jgi:uncharacterized cupin superfamily protein
MGKASPPASPASSRAAARFATRASGIPFRAGDVIATPIRTAHQIINTSDAELRYLAISTMMIEPDIAEYPDSGKRLMLAGAPPGRGPYPLYVLTPNDATADYWQGEE